MSRVNESFGNQGDAGSKAEQMRDKASEVAGNIKDKASDVASNVREMGGQAADAAREQFEHVRETASEYFEHGREKAQKWQHDLEEYVHEQPVKALLIAAGIGVVLGVLWRHG